MVTKEKVKYLSSPKEAPGTAEAAVLGASAIHLLSAECKRCPKPEMTDLYPFVTFFSVGNMI